MRALYVSLESYFNVYQWFHVCDVRAIGVRDLIFFLAKSELDVCRMVVLNNLHTLYNAYIVELLFHFFHPSCCFFSVTPFIVFIYATTFSSLSPGAAIYKLSNTKTN